MPSSTGRRSTLVTPLARRTVLTSLTGEAAKGQPDGSRTIINLEVAMPTSHRPAAPPPATDLSSSGPAPANPDPTELPPDRPAADGAGRPVAIEVAPPHGDQIRRWVEGVLGWQVVDRATGRLVPPTVHLVGPHADPPDDGVPRILVLEADEDTPSVVAACQRLDPAAAVAWPAERDALPGIVDEVVASPGEARGDRHVLRVGGVAGGVGTSTVALALAGLGAWQGWATLAALRGDAPASGLPVVPSEATATADLWSRLQPLDGVPSCRAVRVGDPGTIVDPRDPAIRLAVLDHGVDTDTDIIVCRLDAAALELLAATTAGAIVIVGSGPLPLKALREVVGGRRTVLLPWSVRVARAGLHRRVPASLPGAWLRRLIPLLPDGPGESRRVGGHRHVARSTTAPIVGRVGGAHRGVATSGVP